MRLGVNGWRITGKRTGIGRYLGNIVKHWGSAFTSHEINFYTPVALDLSGNSFPENIREIILPPTWPMLVWENLCLAPAADDDVLFCPSYSRPLLSRSPKVVVSILDAVSQIYPNLFPTSQRYLYNPLYGWSGRNATLVITGSEASRRDVARAWNIPLEKIRTVYLAPAETFSQLHDPALLSKTRFQFVGEDIPFFLFVGKISGRRSLPPLLQAFSLFKKKTSHPHKLLLVGLNPHHLNLQKLTAELNITDHVRYPGYVSDSDLNLLYNAAQAMVMPSVYETLNLPVMEAQATGLPVICIDTAGMREITGGYALLLPELKPDLLTEAMIQMAEDASLRHTLSKQGLAHASQFSWNRCSAETMRVLEEAYTLLP